MSQNPTPSSTDTHDAAPDDEVMSTASVTPSSSGADGSGSRASSAAGSSSSTGEDGEQRTEVIVR